MGMALVGEKLPSNRGGTPKGWAKKRRCGLPSVVKIRDEEEGGGGLYARSGPDSDQVEK